MKLFVFAFLGAAVALLAQTPNANSGASGGFSVPTLGFVPGPTPAQLQPILGIPGSARLGSPLSLPNTVTQIHIAPGHAYALVEQGTGTAISLVSLEAIGAQHQNVLLTPISGAMSRADLLAFSPTGGSAAIYSRQTNQLQVVTGLPKSPQLAFSVSNLAIPNALQKIAISDDARAVLISDGAGSVYSISQNAAPVVVYHSPDISAVAFVRQSRDSIISDRSLNTISVLKNASATPIALGPATNDSCHAEGAATTADGKTILLACPAQHAVLSVDRASGATRVYNVSGSPSSLDNLGARDVFLMSPADGGTYWLLVWQADGPQAFFVAAAADASRGSGN